MLFLFYRLVSYFALVLAPTLDVRVYIYTCIITCYTAPIPRDRLIITCLFVCLGGTSYKKKKHCRVGIVSAYGVCRRGNFFSHPMHKVLKDRRRHHHRCTLCCMYMPLNVVCLLSSSPYLLLQRLCHRHQLYVLSPDIDTSAVGGSSFVLTVVVVVV